MATDRLSLADRITVVIGGATGIGRTPRQGQAEAGAHVIASSRCQEQIDSVAAEVAALSRRSLCRACDVGQSTSMETHRADVRANFGRVDIPIHRASAPEMGLGGAGRPERETARLHGPSRPAASPW